ncbi:Rrf2 family transcriptional regulator [Paenibacillus xylanexedens]|uniref:Rrf2 family transcriptional regulator n=1 Tax=Paenibacillus xylanexedens TaxID=528191 RepID=UPI001C92E398|nr:Rrf2 family transcriptional regulator [Paenibacillus xylanexedens]
MYSSKLSVSVHILCVIALFDGSDVTSERIADSIQTNSALVRRLMSNLKKAGLIHAQTKRGVTGLAKPAENISLKEIFQAVEPQQRIIDIHTDTNMKCSVGANIESALEQVYSQLQEQFITQLDNITLSDIIQSMHEGRTLI